MTKRLLLIPMLLVAGCATEKVSAKEVFAPELTIHSVPEGADVYRGTSKLGRAPFSLPITHDEANLELEARRDGFLAAKVVVDAAGLRKAGGGETWIALKPDTMGTDTPDLDGLKAADLDKGGIALSKAKRCDHALEFFARALAVDPNYVKAHRDRARCLTIKKQFDQAVTELELYLNNADNPPDAEKVRAEIDKLRAQRDIVLPENVGGGRVGR